MTHRPFGVVAVITPYNFPTDISSIALAHIIAAGNTAIWKPSEFSPTCCAMVAELFGRPGFPREWSTSFKVLVTLGRRSSSR